jgi:hypothetical protein
VTAGVLPSMPDDVRNGAAADDGRVAAGRLEADAVPAGVDDEVVDVLEGSLDGQVAPPMNSMTAVTPVAPVDVPPWHLGASWAPPGVGGRT